MLDDYARYDRQRPLKPPTTQPTDPYRRAVLAYIKLIQENSEFDAVQWYDELSGRLIITAPRATQETIQRMLRRFRQHPLRPSVP